MILTKTENYQNPFKTLQQDEVIKYWIWVHFNTCEMMYLPKPRKLLVCQKSE